MVKGLELRRQVLHFLLGIVLVLLLDRGILDLTGLFIILLIGILLSFLSKNRELPGIKWWLKHFDRKNDPLPGYGVITYFLGSIIVVGLFSPDIAYASILVLAFGDSFTHLGRFGRVKNPFNNRKFLEGTVIGIVMGAIGASFFVSWTIAFFGALAAMIAEGLELALLKKRIDDNLIIPLVAGLVMSLF